MPNVNQNFLRKELAVAMTITQDYFVQAVDDGKLIVSTNMGKLVVGKPMPKKLRVVSSAPVIFPDTPMTEGELETFLNKHGATATVCEI